MLNVFKKIVMAFTTNSLIATNKAPTSNDSLSLEELELLLQMLKNVDLKGYQIETFYTLIIKLQNQYIQQSK